jgi:prepilin-type N-terminal cleavage/methylation domain-containing protein
MLKRRDKTRGDTLIEVLFAVSVFSLVAVGAISIMNQGTAASQRALETTLVRQQIDAQAESLRLMHDAYVASYQSGYVFDSSKTPTNPAEEWGAMTNSIKQTAATSASAFGTATTCPTPPSGSFIIDTQNVTFIAPSQGKLQPADSYAQAVYALISGAQVLTQSQGLWIEAISSQKNTSDQYQTNVGYIDFHIRACWSGAGQTIPMTIGTIVRLYEPRG